MKTETPNSELGRFYDYLQSERRYSTHTVSAYRRDINHLFDCLGLEHEQAVDWNGIRQADIRQCVARLHRQGLSGKSLQRWLSSIRSLYKFLCRFHLATNNPATGVPAPKAAKRLPETLNVDEINRLLDVRKGAGSKNETKQELILRDQAIMELMCVIPV